MLSDIDPGRLCACGCGSAVSKRAAFRSGHNQVGVPLTDLQRTTMRTRNQQIREAARAITHKVCNGCKERKAVAEFNLRGGRKGFLRSRCRKCEIAEKREASKNVPAGIAAQRSLRDRLYVEHSLRIDDYSELLAAQGGVCAICRGNPPKHRRRLDVDHCHATGEIRGLLCSFCNAGIGSLRNNPALLREAAIYLETARTGKISRSRRGAKGGRTK